LFSRNCEARRKFLKKYYECEAQDLGCQTHLYWGKGLLSELLFHNARRSKIETMINKFMQESSAVLEVGCAEGHYVRYAVSMSPFVVGLDISQNYLLKAKAASRHSHEHATRTEYVEADAERLPFRDKCFSLVLCLDVLEHLPEPLWAIREIKRVVKKKGILLLSVPTIKSSITSFVHRLPSSLPVLKAKGEGGHIHQFSSYELIEKLRNEQFHALEILGIHNYLTAIVVHFEWLKQKTVLRRMLDLMIYRFNLLIGKIFNPLRMRGIETLFACISRG